MAAAAIMIAKQNENKSKELLVSEDGTNSLSFASCYRLDKGNTNRICFTSRDAVNQILKMYRPKNTVM